ncbi:hypothetical protein K1719_047602 [Acacia pycnantha]|nr:hypothetical protein K1719_047602 [Acacia pycnantha]
MHVSSERLGSHVRHKDRPDRGIWSSFSNGNDDFLSSSATSQVDTHRESKHDMSDAKRGDIKILGNVRSSQSSENVKGSIQEEAVRLFMAHMRNKCGCKKQVLALKISRL